MRNRRGFLFVAMMGVIAFMSACAHAPAQPAVTDDNQTDVEPPPIARPKLVIVTTGTDPSSSFLHDAAKTIEQADVMELKPEEYEQQSKTAFPMVIFDNYQPKQPIVRGGALYFHVAPPGTSAMVATDADGKPVVIHKPVLTNINEKHPVMQRLYINTMAIADAIKLQVPDDWQILASSADGPIIVARKGSGIAEVIVAFEVEDTKWPLLIPPTFKTFIANVWHWETDIK